LRDLKRSTIRSYSEAVRAFCHFATDPAYEWAATCEERFGTHPIQVVHEWNTAVHAQENEADPKKRAFTKAELHAFFAHCDDQVGRIRAFGRLVTGIPRCDAVQDRVRVWVAAQRNEDARRRGLRPQCPRDRVR
jgi:hypothetical protein